MVGRHAVDHRQAVRVEHLGFRTKVLQQALCLQGQETTIRSRAQRAVEQQNARRVRRLFCGVQLFLTWHFKPGSANVREIRQLVIRSTSPSNRRRR